MSEYSVTPQVPDSLPLTTVGVGMILGLSEVTEANWQKVYVRLQLAKQLGLVQENPADTFTPEYVRRHIGHRLAGNYDLTEAAWRTSVFKQATKEHTNFLDAWHTAQ